MGAISIQTTTREIAQSMKILNQKHLCTKIQGSIGHNEKTEWSKKEDNKNKGRKKLN